MKYRNWNIGQRSERAFAAMKEEGVPPLVAAVLCSRGLETLEKARRELSWDRRLLQDPLGMADMQQAVTRIQRALDEGEKIVVYGDYDVDGITSTALLTDFLRSMGGTVDFYIPHRLEEGYGLNREALDQLAQEGASLVITVDCGITAVDEAAYAAKLGLDLVITDHHECKEELPQAAAVVDPHRKDCAYAFKDLAGVGVALKLVLALGGESRRAELLARYCDLTAVGTVADVMRLLGENRALVHEGLLRLRTHRRPGLEALMQASGTADREISSTTVGFCLAPRLNAAGRMGQATLAAQLLLTQDRQEAARLARQLCDFNRARQNVEQTIFQDCVRRLEAEPQEGCIVLAGENWHQGVVGIVASRLTERYACPVFIICLQDGRGKGSCRSYGGFNLFCALEKCQALLEGYGGHALAAGLTIREENVPAFRAAMQRCVQEDTGGEERVTTLEVDTEIHDLSVLSVPSVEQLDMLEPYGAGNPKPVFSLSGMTITCLANVGGGRHLRLRACREGRTVDAIFFSATREQSGLQVGDRADLAFYPQVNEYRGMRSVQLHLVDLRPAQSPGYKTEQTLYRRFRQGREVSPQEAEMMIPSREEFTAVWRYLAARGGRTEDTPARFARNVVKSAGLREAPLHIRICLDVLAEGGLLRVAQEGPKIKIQSLPSVGRVNLEKTALMQSLRRMAVHE